jgi:hypothetical protein
VLLIEEQDGQAVALVDGNGDGAELELEYWTREDSSGWACTSSSGYSGLSSLGQAETWTTDTHVVALGKGPLGADVRVTYAGNTYSRHANEFGIWGFITQANPESSAELPVVSYLPAPGAITDIAEVTDGSTLRSVRYSLIRQLLIASALAH